MVAGVDHGDAFTRDMGYSVPEFFRILPAAISGYDHIVDGDRVFVTHPNDGRQLIMKIEELPDRRIGMIRIPRIGVEFAFHQFTVEQRRAFLTAFDRSFQRGGG